MLAPYASVLRNRGALAFSVAGLVARVPIAMEGLGVVLLVSITEGSYALAGVLASIFAVSASVISPLSSRLTDRLGQRRVLSVLALAQSAAVLGFVVAVREGASVATLVALAVVGGALQPNIGSLVRARWSAMLTGTPELGVAFALESVIDEVIFIIGPVLATALALAVSPGAALVVASALLTIGGLSLATQTSTQPTPTSREDARSNKDRMGVAVPVVALIFACLGIVFGALEVSTVAFATERGIAVASGALLAVFSAGSMIGGLAFGTRVGGRDLPRQLLVVLGLGVVVVAPLAFIDSSLLLGAAGFVAGLVIAPSLICGFTIVENLVPSSRLTESITWVSAGIGLGVAIAASISGVVIDAHGGSAGYLVCIGGALLAAAAGAVTLVPLERAWRARPAATDPSLQDFTD